MSEFAHEFNRGLHARDFFGVNVADDQNDRLIFKHLHIVGNFHCVEGIDLFRHIAA